MYRAPKEIHELDLAELPLTGEELIIISQGDQTFATQVSSLSSAATTLGSWKIKASAYTAIVGDRIQANTAAGSWDLSIPASGGIGQEIIISDATLTWNTYPLIVSSSGTKINGGTANYLADVIGSTLTLVWINSTFGWYCK